MIGVGAVVAVLGVFLVSVLGLAPGSGTQPAGAYFVGDPNVTRNLAPWQNFDSGGTQSVATSPNGAKKPGIIRVADDPLGQRGKVYQETVTQTSRWYGGASRGDWTYLYNQHASYFGVNGQTDWIHFTVMFPAGGAYRTTPGAWNVLEVAHQDSDYFRWSSACEVPELTLTVVQYAGDRHPYLALRIMGGEDTCLLGERRRNGGQAPQQPGRWVYDRAHPLRYSHWYDIIEHVVWSPDQSKGMVEWWLDGRLMFSSHVADLWRRPDGSIDQVEFELDNYRLHSRRPSTVYYGRTVIGPTRSSLG